MAVAFADHVFTVGFLRDGVFDEPASVGAEAHGAAHIFPFDVAFLFRHYVDDWIGGLGVNFSGMGVFHFSHIYGKLDGGKLHTVAEAKVRNFMFPGVADGFDFAFDTPTAETAGDNEPMVTQKFFYGIGISFKILGA